MSVRTILAPGRWALRALGNGAFLVALVPALLVVRFVLPVLLRRSMRS